MLYINVTSFFTEAALISLLRRPFIVHCWAQKHSVEDIRPHVITCVAPLIEGRLDNWPDFLYQVFEKLFVSTFTFEVLDKFFNDVAPIEEVIPWLWICGIVHNGYMTIRMSDTSIRPPFDQQKLVYLIVVM